MALEIERGLCVQRSGVAQFFSLKDIASLDCHLYRRIFVFVPDAQDRTGDKD